ncbi:MAG: alpha/beta hydrolase, partial [Gammaproteobacteria bacterium]|nr:alpha/beta hydrolase [Gammaproteobacteria bacterium]
MATFAYLGLLLLLLIALGAMLYALFPQRLARAGIAVERSLASVTPKQLAIAGFKICYLDGGTAGDDREALVLLHGIGADKDQWNRVTRCLRGRFRVIAPDLPGFGDSDKPPQADYSIPAQVENLKRFLDALGLDRVHLGGNSMGGLIAARFAARYQRRVITL